MTTKDTTKKVATPAAKKTSTQTKKAEAQKMTAKPDVKNVEETVSEEKTVTTLDLFIDHQRQALSAAGKALESMIPEGVREHGTKAVEEMIEGYRLLFNSSIDEVLENVNSTRDKLGSLADQVEKAKLKKDDQEK